MVGIDEYNRLTALLDERRFDEGLTRARVFLEESDADLFVRAKTHNLVCWLYVEGVKRPTPEAALHGEEAICLSRILDAPGLLAESLCNVASAYYQLGDYISSRHAYTQIRTLLTPEPSILPVGLCIAEMGLSHLCRVAGEYDAALRHLKAAHRCNEAEGNRFIEADILRRCALVHVAMNDMSRARSALSQVDEAYITTGYRSHWWRAYLMVAKAHVALAEGDVDVAAKLIKTTMAIAAELDDATTTADCYCLCAKLAKARGERNAHRLAQAALARAINSGRRDLVDAIRTELSDLLKRGR